MPYWLTPPELMNELDQEFHFNFDPCPYPKPSWDGLKIEWGDRTFCNPPFLTKDGGPIRLWVQKAIEENAKGKLVVLLLPLHHTWIKQLLINDDRFRWLGRIKYCHTDTGKPGPNPINDSVLVILRP